MRHPLLLLLPCLLAAVEPGDPGSAPDPARLHPDWPAMARWAAAGVAGGIPAPAPGREVAEGGDLAAALAAGGTLRLAAGVHRLDRPLDLPPGTDVVGDGPGATTILLTGPARLRLSGARSGLRGVTITHEAAAAELAARPPVDAILADRPGAAAPLGHTAVVVEDASDSWIEDCALVALPDGPLTLRRSERLTVRRLRIDGVVHRGDGAGQVRVIDVRDSLLHRLDIDGIRAVRLEGACAGVVLGGSALAVPVRFAPRSAVRDTLFEANLHLIPPGNPWPAFAVSYDPIGPGNTLVDSRVYAQGSDAVSRTHRSGSAPILVFAERPQRGLWDAEAGAWRPAPFLVQPLRPAPLPAITAPAVETIPVAGTGTGPDLALDGPALTGFAAAVEPLGDDWATLPDPAGPAGTPVPAERIREGFLDVRGLAGADKRRLVLRGMLTAPAAMTVQPATGGAAAAVWWISGRMVDAERPVTLAPGRHPVVGVVRVAMPNPFAKRLETRFALRPAAPAVAPAPAREPLAEPPGGSLYAAGVLDRGFVAAWARIEPVRARLAAAQPDGLDAALAALAAESGPAGRIGRRWQAIVTAVETAHPRGEDPILWFRQRSSAYLMAGLPERSWAFETFVNTTWPGAPEPKPERIIP
jgi:hypothetical protein